MQQADINDNKNVIMPPSYGVDDGGSGGSVGSGGTGRPSYTYFTLSFNIVDENGNPATIDSIQFFLTYTESGVTKTTSTERFTSAKGFHYGVLRISSKEDNKSSISLTVYINGQKYEEISNTWGSSYTYFLTVPNEEADGIILPSIYRPFYSQGTILINSGNTGEINFAVANGITYQMGDGNFYLGNTTLTIDGSAITADNTWVTANASGDGNAPELNDVLTGNTVQILWDTNIDELEKSTDQASDGYTLQRGWYGFKIWYRTSPSFDVSGVTAKITFTSGTWHFNGGEIEGDVISEIDGNRMEERDVTYTINKSTELKMITGSSESNGTYTLVKNGVVKVKLSTPNGYTAATQSGKTESTPYVITTYTNGNGESGSGSGSSGSDDGEADSQALTGNTLYRTENELYKNTVITCRYNKGLEFSLGKTHSCTLEITEGSPAGYSGTIIPKTISTSTSGIRFYESIKKNGTVGTIKEEAIDENGSAVTIEHKTFVCDVSGTTSGVRYFVIPSGSVVDFITKVRSITPSDYTGATSWHSIHTRIGVVKYQLYQRELVEYYDSNLNSNQIRVKTVGNLTDIGGDITIVGIGDSFTNLSGNGIESDTEYYNECQNPYHEIVPHTSFMSFIKIY